MPLSDTIMPMVIWLCLRWWYGGGWEWAIKRAIAERLRWCNETFSMTSLMRSWASPFKQVYNKGSANTIDLKVHALIDNTVSRMVGMAARTAIILAGLVSSLFVLITGVTFVALWPLAPLALPISIAMMIFGVGK